MSQEQDLAAVLAGMQKQLDTLTQENKELKAKKTSGGGGPKRIIKKNKANGLYFTDPCMKSYSAAKGKDYQSGINIQAFQLDAFVAFIHNDAMIKDMRKMLKSGEEVNKVVKSA